jgi:RNA polymerase sigma-70 factor (ECF subfamily)
MNLTESGAKPPDRIRTRKMFVMEAFDRYERKLTAYAHRLYGGRSGNMAAARDAVQFTFMKLCQQSPDAIADRLAPWLYTVCRNRVFDELKSQKKRPQLGEERATQIHSDSLDPASRLEIDDFLERLPHLLESLSGNEREVVDLWSQGLKPREIAEVIDKPPGNVRVTLHRGIKKLQKHPEVSPWLERATGQHETQTPGRSEHNGQVFKTTTTGKRK